VQICGQTFSPELLRQIQEAIATQSEMSRRELARDVCARLGWRTGQGAWQEGGCRKALAELERRGALVLPARKCTIPPRQPPAAAPVLPDIDCTLDALGTVELVPVGSSRSAEARLWRALIHAHHYLGDTPLCGAQLRYLVRSSQFGWLGALAFNSAAWALAARDRWIGWSDAARVHNLGRVVCNSRFLIRSGVRVPNLASHVLGLATRRIASDWQQRYGQRPVLLETFVDPTRFDAASYRAANWLEVGLSAGRRDGIAKTILLYPLAAHCRETLCAAPVVALGQASRPAQPDNWAEEEFGTLRVHDQRLTRRVCQIAQNFYNRPQANIPEASGSKAQTMAAYRFFQNDKITMDDILLPHLEATIERIKAHPIVLAPQDTSTLNYSHHPETDGLGPINNRDDHQIGLLLHDTLAFTPSGMPLGVIDAQCWARDPDDRDKKSRRHAVPIEDKESFKWLHSYRKLVAVQKLCPQTMLVSVGDREADVHELFAEALSDPTNPKLLIRAERTRRRRVDDESLWEHMAAQAPAGELRLALPKRGKRAARSAQLQVRHAAVTLQPPKKNKDLSAISLWAVHLVESEAPEDGGEPIEWMLLTTVPVTCFEEAVERSRWYAARWGIEVYHRTLKSGCRIKDRQLGSATRLQNCLAIDMVVAWRLYHLTMLGRDVPDHPCTVFFEDVEWKALWCYCYKTPTPPTEPPSMAKAVRMLGAIGGHLGRRGDGPPGTEVLWRGLQRLDTAVEMYRVFTGASRPHSWRDYPDDYRPPPD
jgi:hypothetical protein